MDINVDPFRVDGEEEDEEREAPFFQEMLVRLKDGMIQAAVDDGPAVQENVLLDAGLPTVLGFTEEAGYGNELRALLESENRVEKFFSKQTFDPLFECRRSDMKNGFIVADKSDFPIVG
jgi:hypothetical protein